MIVPWLSLSSRCSTFAVFPEVVIAPKDRCLSSGIKNDLPQKSFFSCRKKLLVFFSILKPISFLMRMFWLCQPVVCLWMEQRMLSIPAGVSFWCMSQPDVWVHPIIHRRFASNHAVWVSQIGPFLLVWHFVRLLPPFRHFVLCWGARIAFFSSKGQRKLNDCISKVESYPPQLSGIEMRSRHVATNVQGS